MYIESPNAQLATIECASMLNKHANVLTVRGSNIKELLPVNIHIMYPLERFYFLKGRNDNPFHKIAETLWVISGRNDMYFLERYLPGARQWSDDGKSWRAGYGDRLRWYNSGESYSVDQLAAVLDVLEQDRYSRRALISIYNPILDFCDSKDIPCNNTIQFLIRPDQYTGKEMIHMIVGQRSSDLWFGFSGINTFEWSYLHQIMASWTNTVVGNLHYNIGSLHVYEKHWSKLDDLVSWYNFTTSDLARVYGFTQSMQSVQFTTKLDDLDDELNRLLDMEQRMRKDKVEWADLQSIYDPLLRISMQMLYIYNVYLNNPISWEDRVLYYIDKLPYTDFKMAAIYYFARMMAKASEHQVEIAGLLHLSDEEKEVVRALQSNI